MSKQSPWMIHFRNFFFSCCVSAYIFIGHEAAIAVTPSPGTSGSPSPTPTSSSNTSASSSTESPSSTAAPAPSESSASGDTSVPGEEEDTNGAEDDHEEEEGGLPETEDNDDSDYSPICGDGEVQSPEQCDPPGLEGTPDCAENILAVIEHWREHGTAEQKELAEKIGEMKVSDPENQAFIDALPLFCNSECMCEAYFPDGDRNHCGNGSIEGHLGEECDPASEGETCEEDEICRADCKCVEEEACGNGVLDTFEDCDPGSEETNYCEDSEQACRSDCSCVDDLTCGNGIVEPENGEDCDPGEYDVDTECTIPSGREGAGQEGVCARPAEGGDDGESGCVCTAANQCGNGVVEEDESCERDSDCSLLGSNRVCEDCECYGCGDGEIQPELGEECDGSYDDGPELCPGCTPHSRGPGAVSCIACKIVTFEGACGDGEVNRDIGEQCEGDGSSCTLFGLHGRRYQGTCNACECIRNTEE